MAKYPKRGVAMAIARIEGNDLDGLITRCHKRDDICSHGPDKNQKTTYGEEYAKDHMWFHRNDIALFCAYDANGRYMHQLLIYPGKDGIPYGEGIPYATTALWRACCDENRAMLELAKEWPEFGRAMRIV